MICMHDYNRLESLERPYWKLLDYYKKYTICLPHYVETRQPKNHGLHKFHKNTCYFATTLIELLSVINNINRIIIVNHNWKKKMCKH